MSVHIPSSPVISSHVQTYGGLNGYWGQTGNEDLKDYCDSGPEYVTLSFVNQAPENSESGYPGTNFAGHCWAGVYQNKDKVDSHLLSECYKIIEGIPYCQQRGVKVLLSIGGVYNEDGSNYKVTTDDKGVDFADFLYSAFGPYDESWDGPRPFDSKDGVTRPAIDGFDFDIEHDLPNGPYIAMINELRRLNENIIITGAPQCPTSSEYFYMKEMISKAKFDALFVQFYNNPGCDAIPDPSVPWDRFNYDDWETIVEESDCSKDAKIYVGLPSSEDAAPAGGYLEPKAMKQLVCDLKDKTHFAGISLWDLTRGAGNEVDGKNYNRHVVDALKYGCDPVPAETTTALTTTTEAASTTDATTTDITTTDATTSEATTTEATTADTTTSTDVTTADTTTASDVSTDDSSSTDTTTSSDAYTATDATATEATSTSDAATATDTSSAIETTADSTTTDVSSTATGITTSETSATDTESSTGTTDASTASVWSTDASSATTDLTGTTDASAATDAASTSTDEASLESSTVTGTAETTDISEATGSTTLTTETAPESEPTASATTFSTFRGWNTTSTGGYAHTQTYGNPGTLITSKGSPVYTKNPGNTDTVSMTTSTVCTTRVHTVTKCPPEVHDCPAGGYVTTETIPLYTTVCPVTAKATPTHYAVPSQYAAPSQYETKTVYTTSVHTVTKCPPEVVDCPYGSVTTETIPVYTTVCPVTETGKPAPSNVPDHHETKTLYTSQVYTVTQCPPEAPSCAVGVVTTEVASWTTAIALAKETEPINVYKPAAEIPKVVTASAQYNGTVYTKVAVPPATLKTATKPGVVEQPNPTYKQPSSEPPSGAAAPTAPLGGHAGEGYKSTPASITPATAGASSLAVGLTAVAGIALFQVLAL
ncbi:Chitinase 2 [Fusarium torreyae]|uniref:chitinase n=1 Tax=Fusarium torreyae TaxID=1237075 RepID=A0A9W8VDW7_9HYPO|nr:Chitinase 2 [Fusarium torreyae]